METVNTERQPPAQIYSIHVGLNERRGSGGERAWLAGPRSAWLRSGSSTPPIAEGFMEAMEAVEGPKEAARKALPSLPVPR